MYLSAISSRLLLFDSTTWELKNSYLSQPRDGILRDVSWSDDTKYLLQVNAKGFVEILSPGDHDIRALQHIPLKDTWCASFHREGHRHVAVGTKTGNVLIWDTKNKTISKSFPSPAQQNCVNFISFNAKNTNLAATMQHGETIIYGMTSNVPILTIRLPCSKSISATKFHPESRSLLGLATDEGHVVIRDITTNRDKVIYENVHASPVTDIAYSLINKDVMLSSGFDKIVNVYDVRLQTVVSSIRTSFTLTSVAINIENQVALSTKNGTILIYDLRDFTSPLKVLKCQEEEIRRVAFQPTSARRNMSNEISIRGDSEIIATTPVKGNSTPHSKSSDIFYVNNETPTKPSAETTHTGNNNDSFLVMVGLDKSNNLDEEGNKSANSTKKSDKYELHYNNIIDFSKVSTPVSNKVVENSAFQYQPSPVMCNANDNDLKLNGDAVSVKPVPSVSAIDSKVSEELKDFIKLSLTEVADENRNYFLHIMMALTKQKLYLEKQLKNMNEHIQSLVESQNALLETNRKLAIELNQLKLQKNYCLNEN